MMSAGAIQPFYFGSGDKPLFGCCHEPQSGRRRECAVVVCQPVGHEYVNSHRALRRLAARLSDADFPVLRFDYYGCGDSAGDGEAGGIAQWLEDTAKAISEIRRMTGIVRVCLVGLRLGGALAATIGAERGDIEGLVLWDTIVSGKVYLEGLLSLQKRILRLRPKPKRGQKSEYPMHILGFPLTTSFSAELEAVNLLALAKTPAKNVLIIETDATASEDGLRDHLNRTEARVEYEHLEAPRVWMPTADGSLLVPARVLQSVVSWISRACP
jgi:uncharacterized protein